MTTLPSAFVLALLQLSQTDKTPNFKDYAWILASLKSYDGVMTQLGCRLSLSQANQLEDNIESIIDCLTDVLDNSNLPVDMDGEIITNPVTESVLDSYAFYLRRIIKLACEVIDYRAQLEISIETRFALAV